MRWFQRTGPDRDAPPRTPSMRQIRETECGVTALAIVLAHYGAWVPLTELRQRCQLSEQGVTALSLVQAARSYGLSIRAKRLTVDHLKHMQEPAILFWEGWHFLILEGIRGDVAWVNDPARGHRKLSLSTLSTGYSGIALIAQPGEGFQPLGSPPKPMRAAADIVRPGRRWLALAGASTVAESMFLARAVSLSGATIGEALDGKGSSWRPTSVALAGLLVAHASRRWSSGMAIESIAGLMRQRLSDDRSSSPVVEQSWPSTGAMGSQDLAVYPAMAAIRILTAAIRMTIGVPLLVLVLGRVQPIAAVAALPALAAPLLIQRPTARASSFAPGSPVREHGSSWQDIGRWWPLLQPIVRFTPVLITGVRTTTAKPPAVIVALLVSGLSYRLVVSAAETTGILYSLPEIMLQLSELDARQETGRNAA